MTAASRSTRARRRKALLVALALNRGEVDAHRLARLLRECGPAVGRPHSQVRAA